MLSESLKKFADKEVIPYLNESLLEMDYTFQKEKDQLKDEFIIYFRDLCKKILKVQVEQKKEIAYISFTLLRTKLLERKNVYDVHIYGSDWYSSNYEKISEFDITFYYECLNQLWDRWSQERKKFIWKINEADVENIVSSSFKYYNLYLIKMLRYSILDAIDCKEFSEIIKPEVFTIYSGELYDEPSIIYREVNSTHDFKELIENLQDNKPSVYLDLKSKNFSDFSFKDTNLSYSDFRSNSLNNVNFINSVLVGTKFNNCNLKNAKFMNTNICEANFQNANIEGADFTYSFSKLGFNKRKEWIDVSKLPVNFKGANLANTVFKNATMIGTDFSEAIIDGADFTNAILDNAWFTEQQLKQLNLPLNQKEKIMIKKINTI